MKDLNRIANLLEEENSETNNGRGSETVRSIVHYLRVEDLDSAQTVHGVDGDKLRQYPKMNKLIVSLLGCRLHSVVGCKHHWCSYETK